MMGWYVAGFLYLIVAISMALDFDDLMDDVEEYDISSSKEANALIVATEIVFWPVSVLFNLVARWF
jgi:hypothetical protein